MAPTAGGAGGGGYGGTYNSQPGGWYLMGAYNTIYFSSGTGTVDESYEERWEEEQERKAHIRQAKLPPFYIINTKTFMGKVNALVRRLFDKDVKTLMEAGYVSDDFELTEKGKTELLSLLFMNHKAELVKEATKEIEEKKAEKKSNS